MSNNTLDELKRLLVSIERIAAGEDNHKRQYEQNTQGWIAKEVRKCLEIIERLALKNSERNITKRPEPLPVSSKGMRVIHWFKPTIIEDGKP